MMRLISLTSLLLTFATAYRPGDEVCVMNQDNTCPVDKLILSKTDASTLIYPGGKTRCAFDDFVSPRYRTNATYFFQVFPKKQSKKLVLYFQSGGGCVDPSTCNFATQCSLPGQTFHPNAYARSTGILDSKDPLNIFYDWNIVHIPYCTGDIHLGSTIIPANDSNAYFIRKECGGQNMTMHMNGYENSMAALTWAMRNYPHPEQLVLAGSSAGALAAQLMAHRIALLWNIKEKRIKFNVLADSYVGVVPESTTCGSMIHFTRGCDILPYNIIDRCIQGQISTLEIMQEIVRETYFGDYLHITSKSDWVQRFFEMLLEFVRDPKLIFKYLSPARFFDQMNSIISGEKKASTRVSVFFVEGWQHIFLTHHYWYNIKRSITNERLGIYVSKWLNDTTSGL